MIVTDEMKIGISIVVLGGAGSGGGGGARSGAGGGGNVVVVVVGDVGVIVVVVFVVHINLVAIAAAFNPRVHERANQVITGRKSHQANKKIECSTYCCGLLLKIQ